MEKEKRRGSTVVFIIPLIVAFAAASRVAHNIRTVDFLRIFAAGMLVGVTLTQLFLRFDRKKTPAA